MLFYKDGKTPEFLNILEQEFKTFFETSVVNNPLKAEYLLPILIGERLREGKCTVEVLETQDKWFGVTYKEDKEAVMESFQKLIDAGAYREELYTDLK